MILIGASGHAKVICSILEAQGEPISYLVDANPEIKTLLEYKVIHDSNFQLTGEPLIFSIGSNEIRKKLTAGFPGNFGTAIHPRSVIDSNASIGEGTVIMAGAIVNNSTTIGRHCIINTSASIDHDCVIGDYAHISPNSTLCGGITIGEGTHVGAGATVIPNVKIGDWAIIGAGAVVTEDVPDFAVVMGNPARIKRYNERKT